MPKLVAVSADDGLGLASYEDGSYEAEGEDDSDDSEMATESSGYNTIGS